MKKMKIAFISSEAVPFAKTGGLADVSGALPQALAAAGHEVILIIPRYYLIDKEKYSCKRVGGPLGVPLGFGEEWAALYETDAIPGVKTYFIEHDGFFGREGLYDDGVNGYDDNAKRFTFFSRGVMQAILAIDFKPDIVHCNDWQTGLVPIYMKTFYKENPNFKNSKSIMTIHNIGYQGVFWKDEIVWNQLGWGAFTEDCLKFYENINFLKGGILWADAVTTVSKKYAEEITNQEFGYDLSGILRKRRNALYGVLNGVNYSEWNPETDEFISKNFDKDNISNKAECKRALQNEMGLPENKNIPLYGAVTRITHQKGMDVLAHSLGQFLSENNAQFVLLGSGDSGIMGHYEYLRSIFPEKIAVYNGYNNGLAHRIEAGSDMFLMPSRYEPCGLNQMYSLKYGTIPIVRSTGGLDDTVENWAPRKKTGNGFKFNDLTVDELTKTMAKAFKLFKKKDDWAVIIKNAMEFHNSWSDAVQEYEKIYNNI